LRLLQAKVEVFEGDEDEFREALMLKVAGLIPATAGPILRKGGCRSL
jgi:hypothetical protein